MFNRISKKLNLTTASDVLQPYQLRLNHITTDDGFEIPVNIIGGGEPVLLVHAFGMDARQFLPFILPLANQFCFYLPHLRGWGLSSDTPSTQFNFIEQYADDIEVLLTHICRKHHTDTVDVAAISMGALVMWAYFNRHPKQVVKGCDNADHNKVHRYLNIDQSPLVHNQPDWQGGVFGDKQEEIFKQFAEVLEAVLPYIQSADSNSPDSFNKLDKRGLDSQSLNISNGSIIRTPGDKNFSHLPYPIKLKIVEMEKLFSLLSVERLPSRWLVQAMGYQSPYKLALYDHKTWQQKLHGLQAYLTLPFDYRSALPSITNPVTMLIGGKSQLYDPVWQRKVAETLPNAKAIEVAESGHAIPMDAPIRFTRALKQFLTT